MTPNYNYLFAWVGAGLYLLFSKHNSESIARKVFMQVFGVLGEETGPLKEGKRHQLGEAGTFLITLARVICCAGISE